MNDKLKKTIALIPARGGSKEIPRKNIVNVAGRPLIEYSIETALLSNVNEVWVSTDDDEIANISTKAGAKILERPAELATDTASSEAVLGHFTEHVEYESLVFIQATSPLLSVKNINDGISLLSKYDSALTVVKNTQFTWGPSGPNYDLIHRPRRQDMEISYLETGGAFFTSREAFISSQTRISGTIGFVITSKIEALDIDTIEDLELIDKILGTKVK
jgi:CMP-N,N'-diacetyllegionaminic acid synthase